MLSFWFQNQDLKKIVCPMLTSVHLCSKARLMPNSFPIPNWQSVWYEPWIKTLPRLGNKLISCCSRQYLHSNSPNSSPIEPDFLSHSCLCGAVFEKDFMRIILSAMCGSLKHTNMEGANRSEPFDSSSVIFKILVCLFFQGLGLSRMNNHSF